MNPLRALASALLFTLISASALAACSSSPKKGTQVPSEMLGPTENAQAAPAEPPAQPAEPAATSPSPAAAPAALSADEQASVTELATIMKEVTAQFEKAVVGLEQAGGDCKKAATTLDALKTSAAVDQKMIAFKTKLEGKGPPSEPLSEALRKVTLEAFPAALRARADATFERLDKACATNAEFQRAKRAASGEQGGQ